ncbi:hypothetical protein ACIA5D_16220 [Actinoplanes sp. NPDC051513]|uniref:hypothetical protein n=1 Tax=Actinoplanes sp. NPDC051513 TaxID=3363908 RepID=UPI0037967FC7
MDQFTKDVVQSAYRIELADALGGAREAITFPGRDREVVVTPDEVAEAKRNAEELISRPSVRDRLCPQLKAVSDDLGDVAKGVVGAMIPLAIGPQAVMPLSAVAFGALAVIVLRAGVKTLCPDPPAPR